MITLEGFIQVLTTAAYGLTALVCIISAPKSRFKNLFYAVGLHLFLVTLRAGVSGAYPDVGINWTWIHRTTIFIAAGIAIYTWKQHKNIAVAYTNKTDGRKKPVTKDPSIHA